MEKNTSINGEKYIDKWTNSTDNQCFKNLFAKSIYNVILSKIKTKKYKNIYIKKSQKF